MPAIYLFERRTFLGGDDLQPAVFLALLLRLIQLTVLLGPVFAHVAHESRHPSDWHSSSSTLSGFLDYVLYDSNQDDKCRHSHFFGLLLTVYAIASACYAVGAGLLEWRLSRWADVGSPTETQPRSQKVSYLLELKLLPFSIILFLVFCLGLTMISFAPRYYKCRSQDSNSNTSGDQAVEHYFFYYSSSDTVLTQRHFVEDMKLWWVTLALLMLTQLSEVAVSMLYLLHLCSEPRSNHSQFHSSVTNGDDEPMAPSSMSILMEEDYAANRHHELAEEMWAKRCASACACMGVASCFVWGGREVPGQGDFGDVARALADYLETRGVLDVVPSDIAAGFMVLRRLQKARVHRARQEIVQELGQNISTDSSAFMVQMEAGEGREENRSRRSSSNHKSGNGGLLIPLGKESLTETTQLSGPADQEIPLSKRSSASSSSEGPNHDENPLLNPLGPELQLQPRSSRRSMYRYTEDESGPSYERQTRKLLSPSSLVDMTAIDEGSRYAKYALAIYTWVLYLYVHPVSGVPRLAARGGVACCRKRKRREAGTSDNPFPPHLVAGLRGENGRVEGDNMCESHKTALLLTVGLKEADLVYLQLKSGFRDNPYAILLDHEWKSVVVSIRGTFSLEDCVTDVLIEPEPLDHLGQEFGFDAENQFCHGGVLLWVRNIYRDLQQHQLLEKLLVGEDTLYPDYTLRLVGHSLGAAACTILSYMLRSRFPTLRCVNYSPPGCSLTWDLAIGCKDWCSSFVLDSDIVPRLSFESMEAWRDQILELIGRIKVNKAEVVKRFMESSPRAGGNCELCFDPPLNDPDSDIGDMVEVLHDEIPETEYRRQLERFKMIQEERKRLRGDSRSIKLFPPGKMVHLVKTGEQRSCVNACAKAATCFTTNFGFVYTPVWINNNDLNEIVISPQMGTDHFPNRMQRAIEAVASSYGLHG